MKRLLKWTFRIVLVLLLVGFLLGFVAYWSSTNDCNRNAATPSNPMKAIVNCEYGVENLQLRELEKPSPNDNEVLVRVRTASIQPVNITFEQAGSVGIAGVTALQGLRDKGNIQAGQKALINGASGGVGTFAVQIAKAFGAEVTGVCSTRNVDLVKSIGADHVIDYTKEDFTKTDQRYDMIYDLVGNHSFSERRQILTANGICVLAGIGGAGLHPESGGRILGNFKTAFQSKFTSQKFVFYIAKLTKDDLNVLRDLMQSGKVAPVIDRTYKVSETQAAVRYLEEGHAHGKVVITLE